MSTELSRERMKFTRLLLTSILVGGVVIAALQGQAPRKPNIIIIFADDSATATRRVRRPNIRTPRLDAMAAEGQKWTSFYVQPVCSPSRAALLTGRLPVRSGMFGDAGGTAPKVFRDNAAEGLPLAEVTVAELLKAAGYRTGDDRQVAPRPAAAVPADASGLRLVVRPAVLARHADDGTPRQQGVQNPKPTTSRSRSTGTCR